MSFSCQRSAVEMRQFTIASKLLVRTCHFRKRMFHVIYYFKYILYYIRRGGHKAFMDISIMCSHYICRYICKYIGNSLNNDFFMIPCFYCVYTLCTIRPKGPPHSVILTVVSDVRLHDSLSLFYRDKESCHRLSETTPILCIKYVSK